MRDRSSRGFTLVEASVAIAAALILFAAVTGIVMATTRSMDHVSRNADLDGSLKRALEVFLRDFEKADPDTVFIGSGDPDHDIVRFQTVGPYSGSGVPLGAEDDAGTFQQGWAVMYWVTPDDQLLRELQDEGMLTMGTPRVLTNRIDGRFNGGSGPEKGFGVERVPGTTLYDILIRMRDAYYDGKEVRREIRTTVMLRN